MIPLFGFRGWFQPRHRWQAVVRRARMSEVVTQPFAAIQFQPELGNVSANLKKVSELVNEGLAAGARCVMLPGLFTTGVAFDDSMLAGLGPLTASPLSC